MPGGRRGAALRRHTRGGPRPRELPRRPLHGGDEGLRLSGSTCRPIAKDEAGRLASEELGLRLGPWDGDFNQHSGGWVRCYTPDGATVPTRAEAARAEAEAARAEAEAARRAEAEARAEELARRSAALEDELRRR